MNHEGSMLEIGFAVVMGAFGISLASDVVKHFVKDDDDMEPGIVRLSIGLSVAAIVTSLTILIPRLW